MADTPVTMLNLTNRIMHRLREAEVNSLTDTDYARLMTRLINDAKREVEDSHNWSGLRVTLSTNTTADVFSYELNGSGNRITILDVINDTDNVFMQPKSSQWMNEKFLLTDQVTGSPMYYAFNGLSLDDDSQIDIYPIPDKAYTIRVNCVLRTAEMTADTDSLYVPAPPVQLLAYAKAVEERGEDGGMSSASAYATAQRVLNDAIAQDAQRHTEELEWVV